MADVLTYTPPPSLAGFLTSNAFVSLVTGPVGSGKSSAAMLKIAYHAARMKPGADGIRRSRAVVVRNTRQMLTDATIPTFMTWFPDGIAGTYVKSDTRFLLRFDNVECDVLFRGLDDSNDVRRLLSLEVSFGVLDEFREINQEIFHALQSRVGRYPAKKMGGAVCDDKAQSPNYHIWGASNAPDRDTFWADYMESPPGNTAIFRQPSALSPEADWIEHLADGYYENIVQGKTEEWIAVYVHNEFGRSLAGQPVFKAFNRDTHVAGSPLKWNAASVNPLIIGFDCGLTPTATIGQVDYSGRLLVYRAVTSDGMGALRFAREKLKPLLNNEFPGAKTILIGDPAGQQRAQTDERSVFDILRAEKFVVKAARTNSIAARVAAVDTYLTRMVEGKPGFLIDPSCRELILAMQSKYRYKMKTTGEMEDTPEKNHPWSDLADSLQYLCLHADAGAAFGQHLKTAKKEVKQVQFAYA